LYKLAKKGSAQTILGSGLLRKHELSMKAIPHGREKIPKN